MSLPLSIRTLFGLPLLLAFALLSAPAGAQSTEADDQQPSSQGQSDTQEDQSSENEATADEQLPPQPSDTQSPDQSSQDQSQYDQQQYDNQGESQQYDRQADPRRQEELQRQQQYDRATDSFDQPAEDRPIRDRQLQGERDRQRQDQQQFDRRQFDQRDRQNRGSAADRAFQDRLDDGQFDQQTTFRSTEDLGLRINERDNGLAVVDIDRSSVLIDSGLRPGDVLISVRNQPLRRSVDLVRWVRTLEPGARVPIQILRDGRRETIYITGIDFERLQSDRGWYDSSGGAYLGVVFDDRYPSMALVEVVRPNTAADRAGLRQGDVIHRINGRRVNGLQHATSLISQMQPGDEVELEFSRRTTNQAVARLGSRPDARQATYYDGEDFPAYDRDIYQDRGTEYSEEIRTYDDDTPRRVRSSDDDPRFGDRLRDRAPIRRGLVRPFRNQ